MEAKRDDILISINLNLATSERQKTDKSRLHISRFGFDTNRDKAGWNNPGKPVPRDAEFW